MDELCRRRMAGVAIVLGALGACAPPPPGKPAVEHAYAGRIDLAGLDTSPLRGRRILIDPGHGGPFDGAEGAGGTREADVNLGVGLHLWGLLRDAGADVHLTRASDRAVGLGTVRDDLAARVDAVDSLFPEVFLSLHHNSHAGLDRERNAIETYFKLDDDGPSYDLGRAISARLAQSLGIDEARLLPGNYFVLREVPPAAVLGEASYLSSPGVERRLQLASSERLEAAAFFLGLLDYFARGTGTLARVEPAGDTLLAGAPLRFAASAPLDPLSVEVRAGDAPLPTRVDASSRTVEVLSDLEPGTHAVVARARLAGGNAARPWRGRVVVHAAAARCVLSQEPAVAAPGSPVRVAVAVQDARGRAVGDGTPVELGGEGVEIVDAESTVRAGEVRAVLRAVEPGAHLRIRSGALDVALSLAVRADGVRQQIGRCSDARSGVPLEAARVAAGVAASDRGGWVLLSAASETLSVERRGYVPWRGTVPADGALRLEPLDGGILHGVVVGIDPGGEAGEPAANPLGAAPADLAHAVCRMLAEAVQAAGGRAVLLRGAADRVPDVERVRQATRARVSWYVRVEVAPDAARPSVRHYPGSADGERCARALAAALSRCLGAGAAVRSEARFILQQTPCPAALVELPLAAAATVEAERRLAAALLVGLRATLDPATAALPPLLGRVVPPRAALLAVLDGAIVQPVASDGTFRFDAVAPGVHWLQVADLAPTAVAVTGNDTTRVTVGNP